MSRSKEYVTVTMELVFMVRRDISGDSFPPPAASVTPGESTLLLKRVVDSVRIKPGEGVILTDSKTQTNPY